MNQQVKPSQYGYGKASLENYRSRHYYKSSITLDLTTHISNEKRCYKGDIWRVVSYYLKKNHPNYNLSLSRKFLWKNEVKEANADSLMIRSSYPRKRWTNIQEVSRTVECRNCLVSSCQEELKERHQTAILDLILQQWKGKNK